jgi:hypothetical protein
MAHFVLLIESAQVNEVDLSIPPTPSFQSGECYMQRPIDHQALVQQSILANVFEMATLQLFFTYTPK